MALLLAPETDGAFVREPPGFAVHRWTEADGFASDMAFVGPFRARSRSPDRLALAVATNLRVPVLGARRKGTAMHGIEQRIRERAYLLWEEEGRPEGRELEYWERARRLIGAGEAGHDAGNGRAPIDGSLNGAKAASKSNAKSNGKRRRAASASAGPVAGPGGERPQTKPT